MNDNQNHCTKDRIVHNLPIKNDVLDGTIERNITLIMSKEHVYPNVNKVL